MPFVPPQSVLPMLGDYFRSRKWDWAEARSDLAWAAARLTRTTRIRVQVTLRGVETGWTSGTLGIVLWRVELDESLRWRIRENEDFAHCRVGAFNRGIEMLPHGAVHTSSFDEVMAKAQLVDATTWFSKAVRDWVRAALPIGHQIDFLHDEDRREGILYYG